MSSRVPLLTIGIPTYNRKPCLSRMVSAVKKFSNETLSQIQLQIVDNHSNDGTSTFCQKQDYDWFKYHRNNKNIGATQNLFKVIEVCESEYLWWMGDDDFFTEQNVIKTLEKLEQHNPDILVVNRLVENDKNVICESVLGAYLSNSLSGTLNEFLGKTGVLTGIGCISTLIFRPIKDEELNKYFSLETSYPQLAYLIKNFGQGKGYFDLDNIIRTYTENSRPETYESGNLNKHLVKMATGIPKMYSFLFNDLSLSRETLKSSREYSWSRGSLVPAPRYHFLLYLRLSVATRFSFSDMKNLNSFFWELSNYFFVLLVPIVWFFNQFFYFINKLFLFLGINLFKYKIYARRLIYKKQ